MSLSIELSSESQKPRIFSQGELVSGKVIFNCSKSEDVSAIVISLKGEVRTRVYAGDIQSDLAHTCNTTLFEINQTLFEGPYTVPAGTHEYGFQFTFPEVITEPINHKFEQDPNDPIFTSHIDDKALPPSCEMDEKGTYSNGIIVYELHAKIPRKLRDLKATQQITFHPYRREDRPDPAPKTVSKPISHHLHVADNGVSLRELTTGEAFKEKLHHSSNTRTVTFNVSFTAPTAIILGEMFPLKMAIHPDPNSNEYDTKLLSSFSLKEYRVSMHGRFAVRADFALFSRPTDEAGQCEKIVEISKSTDSIPMALGEETTLDTITLDPMTFAPTFQSFQMTGSWQMHVKAKVMFGGKEFTVFILLNRVTLLSPKVHTDLLGSAPDYDKVVVSSKEDPPAYESSNVATDTKQSLGPF